MLFLHQSLFLCKPPTSSPSHFFLWLLLLFLLPLADSVVPLLTQTCFAFMHCSSERQNSISKLCGEWERRHLVSPVEGPPKSLNRFELRLCLWNIPTRPPQRMSWKSSTLGNTRYQLLCLFPFPRSSSRLSTSVPDTDTLTCDLLMIIVRKPFVIKR